MGRIAQDICLRWRGPNPFLGQSGRLIYGRRVVKWATIRQQFAPTTGSDLALCRPFGIRQPECNSLGSRMAKYSMPRRGRWSALFATGKSSGLMECLSATSQAYARPERRPMRSRGSLKRRTNSRRLETLLSEWCLIEDFEGSRLRLVWFLNRLYSVLS